MSGRGIDPSVPTVEVYVVKGVEGHALVVADRCVAGPKPWGGGDIVHTWRVPIADLEDVLAITKQKAVYLAEAIAETRP